MSYTVGTIQGTLPRLMSGRNMQASDMADWIRKAVLELTESYKFPALQATGPTVQLTMNNPGPYPYSTFLQPADSTLEIECIDSFFLYYQTPTFPLTATNGENPGYPLHFRTIDTMEIEINIAGIPIHWTRHEGQLYFGFAPNQTYYLYARYRKEHPFSTPPQASDVIFMPNSWQDIVEYASAERAANEMRLWDIAKGYHTAIYGDPLFERSGGTEGCPGLVFKRVSQEQQDQGTTTKQMRVAAKSCM